MKITNFALIGVLVLLPFLTLNHLKIQEQKHVMQLEYQYDSILHAAVEDAARALLFRNQQAEEASYESDKKWPVNKEAAVQAFFDNLYRNFGVGQDKIGQSVLNQYIPCLVLLEYDGYDLYVPTEYQDASGENVVKFEWVPKKRYAWADASGNSLAFTLDDYVYAYEKASARWEEGKRADLQGQLNIPLLADPVTFDSVRRATILSSIENDLEYQINQRNITAKQYGITYTFTLPTIPEEQWNNTLDDVGVLAFLQGVPLANTYYNNYAFSGSKVVKKRAYTGMIQNGVKVFYPQECGEAGTVTEIFSSPKEAAQKGYFRRDCGP